MLLDHGAIADAAVIGVPTEDGDERPRAYVVLQPRTTSKDVSEKDIVTFIQTRVAPFKRLTGGVVFLEAIPKNPSGKILRRQLREQARNEEQKPSARL